MTENVKVVISPGAFLMPYFYDEFRDTLKKNHGIESIAVKHRSANAEKSEQIGLQHDVENMQRAILDILDTEKKDVVLFAHSYGGIVASSACEGLSKAVRGEGSNGIIRVVYCTAYALEKGQSLEDALSQGRPRNSSIKVDTDLQHVRFDFKSGNLSDIEVEALASSSATTSMLVWNGKTSFDPSRNGIPTTYIIARRDTLTPPSHQEEMKDKIQPDSVYELESDQFPTVTHTKELAAMIAEVVRK